MENILDTQRTVWLDKKAGVRNKPAKLPAGRVQFFCINIDLLGTYFSDGEQQLDMNGQPLHVFPRIFPNDECKAAQDSRFRILTPYLTRPLFNRHKSKTARRILTIVKLLLAKQDGVAYADIHKAWSTPLPRPPPPPPPPPPPYPLWLKDQFGDDV